MSVRVNNYVINTDENPLFPSQLINSVSGIPYVSKFISDRTGNVFLKRPGTKSRILLDLGWSLILVGHEVSLYVSTPLPPQSLLLRWERLIVSERYRGNSW